MSTASVTVRGLRKRYSLDWVLEGIDFAVRPGQIFGYLGPNGAGKSTTIKILTGQLGDYEGEASVAGFDPAKQPLEVKRVIGYVPENAHLYESLTLDETLTFVGQLHGLDERLVRARSRALLENFDLDARRGSRVAGLSKGMRQKLLIAAALLHAPEILFLDEPLSGLDVGSTILVKELIRAFADAGGTVFYSSHMMDVVEKVCDRIVILDRGRIVADGAFEELSERSGEAHLEGIFAELTGGEDGTARAEAIVEALRDG